MTKRLCILLSTIIFPFYLLAQTGISGVVLDSQTKETIPFAQILFTGSTIGTTSDMDGNFSLETSDNFNVIEFRMVGYKTQTLTLRRGQFKRNQTIMLEPETFQLEDVVVRPTNEIKTHYRRKGNPAVELIKNVIEHKFDNQLVSRTDYSYRKYEKLTFSLDPFDFDLDSHRFWSDFKFVENYVDTSRFDSLPTLAFSIRETITENYHTYGSDNERVVRQAYRWEGIDKQIGSDNLTKNISQIIQPINIFQNDINCLLNRFVSPLSSTLAVAYYQYYLQDTLVLDGDTCIDLAFVPVNSESYAFTGHLYIVKDSTYALKQYSLNVPMNSNMNWVSGLQVEQQFHKLENGKWVPEKTNSYTKFSFSKKSKRSVYAVQHEVFDKFQLDNRIDEHLFFMSGNTIDGDSLELHQPEDWINMRPVELSQKEFLIDSLAPAMMTVPKFRFISNLIQDLVQEYAHTADDWQKSKWDFGPIFNSISYNEQEGVRLRIGGMTTANLNPHWFLSGYVAFGTADLRPKGGLNLTYSFNKKKYYPFENLRHYLMLSMQYDIEELGQTYSVIMRDHILMSIKFNYDTKPVYYVGRIRLKYEKEWANEFSVITWAEFMNAQPNGAILRSNQSQQALFFNRINGDGSLTSQPFYHDSQWVMQLRYSPGGYIYNDRQGEESPFNLWKDAPVFRFTNYLGYILEEKNFYCRTEMSAEKRFWLSSFGHLDMTATLGYVWTKSPYTKLFTPVTNQSILLDPRSFHLMRPVEFMMDRYVAFYSTYYAKGWVLNRIPYVNKLKLRGVASFQLLAGWCSDKNNPYAGATGVYQFPVSYYDSNQGEYVRSRTDFSTSKANYMPYMEMTVGIENIFRVIRIDYVRRLTHTEGLSGWQLNGIRFTLRAAI